MPIPTTSASSTLAVTVDWPGGAVLLSGELDRDSAHDLLEALEALAVTGHRVLSVDAADVTFCDAGGLRALVVASRRLRAGGRDLRVLRASRCVGRLLALAGLDCLTGTEPPAAAINLTARRELQPRAERTTRLALRTATA
ncbi:STAS domain-containing protein [Modestobacter marinus]|uniref:STAS domain-containing protein n=1 Tax=Modestobacter marinus TaxID=477641 RepID=UPI001C972B70|nr:STAS domain-containing protein [Modestobacter marinus]